MILKTKDMVFRMELTNSEIENDLDMNNIDASTTGYTLESGIYEVSEKQI